MDTAPNGNFSISQARLTAYGAVLLLVGFIGWNALVPPQIQTSNAPTPQIATDESADYLSALASSVASQAPEGITPLGSTILAQSFLAFEEGFQGASSSEAGFEAVKDFGKNVKPEVAYKTYASSDIKTAPETSKERALAYRADLRVALEPLLENKVYELDIFAQYVETKDKKYLTELQTAAQNYRLAIDNTEKVVAPEDAAIYQAAILTAMSKFAAMLDALQANSSDPFATAALMRTFLDAQDTMLSSFNSIAKYSQQKLL